MCSSCASLSAQVFIICMDKVIEIMGICEECEWIGFVTINNPRSRAYIVQEIESAHDSRRMFCNGSLDNGSVSVGPIISGSIEGLPDTHTPTAEEARITAFLTELFTSVNKESK
jgi:hypothetical protein